MTIENEMVYTPALLMVIELSAMFSVTPLEGPTVWKLTFVLDVARLSPYSDISWGKRCP